MNWAKITREERYFTSFLFHDIRNNPEPFETLLDSKLNSKLRIKEKNVGFEVCYFRDAAKANLIERSKEKEKQTFDLYFWFTDNTTAILEAKAQTSFKTKQINELINSKKTIEKETKNQVRLIGLISSKYQPAKTTSSCFDCMITWEEIAKAYSKDKEISEIYQRANDIYNDR